MKVDSLEHIDLSGLSNRKVQYLCICLLCLGIALLSAIHQKDLFLAPIDQATIKAQAKKVTPIQKEGMTYYIYYFRSYTHTSLFPSTSHDQTIYYVKNHPHIFYSAIEKKHIKEVRIKRSLMISTMLMGSLFFFIKYRKTQF